MFASVILDREGRVRDWSDPARRLFGHAPAAVTGGACGRLLHGGRADEAAALMAEAARAGWAERTLHCVRADGTAFPAHVLVTAVREAGATSGYVLVAQDLTETVAARERHLDDEARLLTIIESAMDGIVTIDEAQNIVLFNGAAEKIFRCPAKEAIGGPLDRFIPERFRATHRSHVERFAGTGVTSRRMGDNTVLTGLRADGAEFPLEASISQSGAGGQRLFTVIMRDITERVQAAQELETSHRQLQRLYAAMHEVREAERTRIARELHDELAQWLTALKMDASWLAQRVDPQQQQIAAKIEKMKAAVDTTVASVRRIAADLRPVMLDDLGLAAALENLVHDFSDRIGIMGRLRVDFGDAAFPEPIASAVYRMVQEALSNVARHAGATAVEVAATLQGGRLAVNVVDNGRGIRPADLEARESYGLLGIRERAHTLGGTARIYSPAEGGTAVEVEVPIAAYQTGDETR